MHENSLLCINPLQILKIYDVQWLNKQGKAEELAQLPLSLLSCRLERLLKNPMGGFIFIIGHELSHLKHRDNDIFYFDSAKIIFDKFVDAKKKYHIISTKQKDHIFTQSEAKVCAKSVRREYRADKEALDHLGGGEDAMFFFSTIKTRWTNAGIDFEADNKLHPSIDTRIALAQKYKDKKIATLKMKSDWYDLYNDLYDTVTSYNFAALLH
jgi:hypothetical protein